MFDSGLALTPEIVKVSFGLEPAYQGLHCLFILNEAEQLSVVSEWVVRAVAAMSPERRRTHAIVMNASGGLGFGPASPADSPDFLAYLDKVAAQDPVALRDQGIDKLIHYLRETVLLESGERLPTREELLADLELCLAWWRRLEEHEHMDESTIVQVHALLNDPAELAALIVSHMRIMWYEVLASEWQRSLPILQEALAAHRKVDYSGLTALEAIKAVTGRDLSGKWDRKLDSIEHLVFIPTTYLGPYVSLFCDGTTGRVMFGARLPKGAPASGSALSYAELLTRLNALADETRLRMLGLLGQEGELCAQDIMTRLGLTQSSTSRHLRHLVAAGYLTERRQDVEKCYSLNPERLEDTARALVSSLVKKTLAHA